MKQFIEKITIEKLILIAKLENKFNSNFLNELAKNIKLSDDIMIKYFDMFKQITLFSTQTISHNFVKKMHKKIDWYLLLKYHKLKLNDIKKYYKYFYKDFFCLRTMIINQTLNEKFIRKICKNFDKYCWTHICYYQNVSDQFIKEYINNIMGI